MRDNYIYVNILYYCTQVAVSTDGKKNNVINGVPDWVYQEELDLLNGMAWSPDNLTLSFIRWDESNVKTYPLQMYHGACNPIKENELYPGMYEYKYTKDGCDN